MTRLIDADALRDNWLCLIGDDFKASDFVRAIDEQPTAEAIPIEFIDKRIVELTKLGAHVFTANGGYVSSVDFRRYELEEIIKIWRKEHDKTD